MFKQTWLGLDVQETAINAVAWHVSMGRCVRWQSEQILLNQKQKTQTIWHDPNVIYQALLQLASQWDLQQKVKVYLNLPTQHIFQYHLPWPKSKNKNWKTQILCSSDLMEVLPWPREETYLDACFLSQECTQIRVIGIQKKWVEMATGIIRSLGFYLALFDLYIHCLPYFKNARKSCVLWLSIDEFFVEFILCFNKKIWNYKRLELTDVHQIIQYLDSIYLQMPFEEICVVGNVELISSIRDWASVHVVSFCLWRGPQGLPLHCIAPWALLTRGYFI